MLYIRSSEIIPLIIETFKMIIDIVGIIATILVSGFSFIFCHCSLFLFFFSESLVFYTVHILRPGFITAFISREVVYLL